MFWRRHQNTSANDFALLVAIPLDRDEFVADHARRSDFLRNYAAAVQSRSLDLWDAYRPYAELCGGVVADIKRLGVAVFPRATLATFLSAVARYRVVTLVAHSRGPEIDVQDLYDLEGVIRVAAALRAAVNAPPPGVYEAKVLASTLNAALGPEEIESAAGAPETEAFAWRVARYRARWERRNLIDQICRGALTGGPAIEFQDGLVPIETIRDRMPPFEVLDLTVCDSVLLAECLREKHAGGVILANPRPTTPDFRLVLYREAVRFACRHGSPYSETVIRLRRTLMRQTA